MPRPVLIALLFLGLAACGGKGASTTVKVGPNDEALVTFRGKTFAVTLSNEGPSPVQVLWPSRMLDITLPAGADSGETLSGDIPIRIRCEAPEGATVRVSSPDAEGVSSKVTTAPPKGP